jgi:hypothetical protein
VLAFYSPGGDFINTSHMEFEAKEDCEIVKKIALNHVWPLNQTVRAVCVDVTQFRKEPK